ncbi:MAG: hypothetical protein PHX61_06460 [Alphaproteobacteria bacterium]|nr:hypothetical protein [Alphaproteobacteria bacterium]
MLKKNELIAAKSMRLWTNKLRVAFGGAAALPTNPVCESLYYSDFTKGDNFKEIRGPERKATLYYPDNRNYTKGFSREDMDSLRDYVEDQFRRAGVAGGGVEVEILSYCRNAAYVDVRLFVPQVADVKPLSSPEDKMNQILLDIERVGTKLRFESLKRQADEFSRVFGIR